MERSHRQDRADMERKSVTDMTCHTAPLLQLATKFQVSLFKSAVPTESASPGLQLGSCLCRRKIQSQQVGPHIFDQESVKVVLGDLPSHLCIL